MTFKICSKEQKMEQKKVQLDVMSSKRVNGKLLLARSELLKLRGNVRRVNMFDVLATYQGSFDN